MSEQYDQSYEEIPGVVGPNGEPLEHRRATRPGSGVGSHEEELPVRQGRNHELAFEEEGEEIFPTKLPRVGKRNHE